MLSRRSLLAVPLLAAPALASPALAQERFPSRPLRLIIPVGVGGVTDVVGRILAEAMAQRLGKPVVPEAIPGAGSRVGAAAFMRLPADGYSFFIGTNNHPVMKAMDKDFAFDPVTDFVPFCLAGRQPFMLAVHPSVPAQDLPGLLAWLRQQKDAANYGATNPGASNHLAGELFKQLSGMEFTVVPYRTAANAVQDLVAGRMNFTIDSPTMLRPLMQDGRVRGLAVTGADRSEMLPGLPTISESGVPGYDMTAWQVLFAKPGTPPEALAVLTETARQVVTDPVVKERLLRAGVETWPDPSPAAAMAHVQAEVARWAPIVARMGLAN